MTSPALEDLRRKLRAADQTLLRALDARARFPRTPWPRWPATAPRLPAPPLDDILLAIAPPGTAADPAAADQANHNLIAGLLARQHLARDIAEAKAEIAAADCRPALETGDRERLLDLLTDLPAELHRLDDIRRTAPETAPALTPDLAALLWREYLIPWARQTEVAHLLEP